LSKCNAGASRAWLIDSLNGLREPSQDLGDGSEMELKPKWKSGRERGDEKEKKSRKFVRKPVAVNWNPSAAHAKRKQ